MNSSNSKGQASRRPFLLCEGLLFVYIVTVVTLTAAVQFHMISNLIGMAMTAVFLLEICVRKGLPSKGLMLKPLAPLFCLLGVMILWLPFFTEAFVRVKSLFQIMVLMVVVFNILRLTARTWPLEYGFLLGLAYIWRSGALSFGLDAGAGQRFEFAATGFSGHDDGLNPNIYGLYCCAYILFAVRFIFITMPHHKKTIISWGRLVFACIGILLSAQQILMVTGSRKSMLMLLIISAGVYLLYTKGRLNFIRMVPGFILGSVACAYGVYKIATGSYAERFISIFYGLQGGYSGDGSFDIRQQMIYMGIELWLSSPLFGHGNEAFRVMSGLGTYSHSTPIELLANYGVIGLVCYYLFYVLLIRRLLPMARSQDDYFRVYGIWTLLSFACILFWSLFAVCYYEKPIAMFLAALAGLAYHYQSYLGRGRPMSH